jgi:hypothetical protein
MNNTMQTMAATFWASQRPIVAVLRAKPEGLIVWVCKIGVLRGFKLEPRSTYTGRHLSGSRPVCGPSRPINKTWRHVDRQHGRNIGKNSLLMTLYIFPKKSIITLFRYCIYTALYNHSTTFSLLYMYSNTKSLHKNDDFLAHIEVDPPLPIFLNPFFSRSHFGFFPCN